LVKSGQGGNSVTVFVLPDEFRPETRKEMVVACSNDIPCEVIFWEDGRVTFETSDPGWVSLDGLQFLAKR
jgi:hypothetical protein